MMGQILLEPMYLVYVPGVAVQYEAGVFVYVLDCAIKYFVRKVVIDELASSHTL
jgi:hypothetical protein